MEMRQQDNAVEVQERDPQPVVSIRAIIPIAQLGAEMGERLQALGDYLRQQGAQPAGPPFVRYHTFGETETDMETGIPVVAALAGAERIAGGELPGGLAIATWHFGPHDKLGEAYARLDGWLKAHSREPAGASWEVYHWIDLGQEQDPATGGDPTTRGTQLIQPIT